MSDLPEIDSNSVINRLSSEISALVIQRAKLEILSETLRAQRDQANSERDAAYGELNSLRMGVTNAVQG
ncbi:Hypothetical Protein OBI_RACECAR_97 [Arthrobacter phage Racecar]|nr:hypothetical protein PBI_RACECAR_179 [Arthrobacter phage Racecar]QFG12852.1 hypothetical protein PBI_MIMI_176 [Arthrobacter phage Mimi]